MLEIVVGACLLLGLLTRVAGGFSALLQVAFIIGIASVWSRGIAIDCGCFGNGGQVSAGQTAYPLEVLRDATLLVVALALVRRPASRLALGSVQPLQEEVRSAR